jgi:uncharacterized membrane protein
MNFREIKAHARESLKGNWLVAIIASFIAGTFTAAGGGATTSTGSDDVDFSALSQLSSEEIITTLAVFGGFILFGLVVSVLISSLISVGYAQFNLDLVDGVKPTIVTMFSKGKQVWTTICANVLIFIRVLLGTILFVIPGIIASYKYSMVNYIIAENPGITAREALEMSKEMMKGNKFRFFMFGLSFFGWALVVVLTFGIASIWVAPYMQASFAKFYREIA